MNDSINKRLPLSELTEDLAYELGVTKENKERLQKAFMLFAEEIMSRSGVAFREYGE